MLNKNAQKTTNTAYVLIYKLYSFHMYQASTFHPYGVSKSIIGLCGCG